MSTKNQLVDIFTKALGMDNFLRLLRTLGITNIFAQTVEYPKAVEEKKEAGALLLRGSVENQVDRSDYNCREINLEHNRRAKPETPWACKELLDLIEVIPFHEQFIHLD